MGFSFIEGAPCLEVRYWTPRSSRRDTCLSPYLNWALRRCRELPRAARSRVSGFVLWPIAAVRNGLGIRQLLGAKRTCPLSKILSNLRPLTLDRRRARKCCPFFFQNPRPLFAMPRAFNHPFDDQRA